MTNQHSVIRNGVWFRNFIKQFLGFFHFPWLFGIPGIEFQVTVVFATILSNTLRAEPKSPNRMYLVINLFDETISPDPS
ncbi:LOW QUALITY PROTEIN: hypothetical protein PanWU01x14_123150 [Parasponia andersonii]|uniref:Uncharacterized protein n=1 Tax=Parasponia andersonii TaxID=3476 RepID=A0A2P5CU69_PARAD|nr:LOW QUALITY PROTEIN: hypothetical protein PanWU01x14_123150 [Parasponia andersonii]